MDGTGSSRIGSRVIGENESAEQSTHDDNDFKWVRVKKCVYERRRRNVDEKEPNAQNTQPRKGRRNLTTSRTTTTTATR